MVNNLEGFQRCVITFLEGLTVITKETQALLLDTFDNIEEEEFFEVESLILLF